MSINAVVYRLTYRQTHNWLIDRWIIPYYQYELTIKPYNFIYIYNTVRNKNEDFENQSRQWPDLGDDIGNKN